jgi:membrane-anchored protein YejM (alkaline phosphatase superfamily)
MDAKRVVSDPDLGLILVHWPIPHAPNFYSRQKNDFEIDVENSYLDNLQLVDRTLGELRTSMENAGTWDDTIVLVTSDHWWRPFIWRSSGPWTTEDENTFKSDNDHRVPFILKLARQKHQVTCDAVFNNVLIHDLILALLQRDVVGPDSVLAWIEKHRSIGESPYRFEIPK